MPIPDADPNPMPPHVLVLGSFVADLAFRTHRLPAWGETLLGEHFALGPGGKGSNQAVAAARAGASVRILSRVGDDAFGRIARELWQQEGIDATLTGTTETPTGAAAILIDHARGENAIIVTPGACFTLQPADLEPAVPAFASATVVLAQLELPLATVQRGLELARAGSAITILNPAPAAPLPADLLALADFLVPNETEAACLTGLPVTSLKEAEAAARDLQRRGARNVLLTLGERGLLALLAGRPDAVHIDAFHPAPVVETTGAGDAFCGAFAAALAEGRAPLSAARFGCAGAGFSVTRPGTAPSMPFRREILELLA